MKRRYRSALPPLDRTSWLPLLMAMLLAAAFALQLLAPGDSVVPPTPPMRPSAAPETHLPQMPPSKGGAAADLRRLFTPATASQSGDALAGTTVVGAIQVGQRRVAVIQGPDGRVAYVRPGGRIAGWQLQRVAQNEVMLRRGDERLAVPFGGRAMPQSGTVEGASQ